MPNTLDFIEQMRQKYNVGNSGPTVHATLPTPMRYGMNPEDFAAPDANPQNGNGTRYTGRSANGGINPNAPAGIVHEGEMVVSKPNVDMMGGPQNAQKQLENNVARGGMPGYKAGGVVTNPSDPANPGGAQTTTSILDTDQPDLSRTGTSEYSKVTQQGIKGIQDIATGVTDTQKALEKTTMNKMGGEGAARTAALNQSLAQAGAEGGSARVAQAMESRQQGMEKADVRGRLAVTREQEQTQATKDLADIGMRGEQIEEAKHQFDVSTQQHQAEFKENTRQWGEQFAQSKSETDWNHNSLMAQNMINAGDYEGAAKTYAKMGYVNSDGSPMFDTSVLKDKANQEKLNSGMDGVASAIASGLSLDNAVTQDAMKRTYEATHPGKKAEGSGDPLKPNDYDNFAKATYDTARSNNDPVQHAIKSMTDETLSGIFGDLNKYQSPNFKDAKGKPLKGRIAAEREMSRMTTGFDIDEQGNLHMIDPDTFDVADEPKSDDKGDVSTEAVKDTKQLQALNSLSKNPKEGEEQKLTTGTYTFKDGKWHKGTAAKGTSTWTGTVNGVKYSKIDEFKNSAPGSTVEYGEGSYYVPKDGGEPFEIDTTDITNSEHGSGIEVASDGKLKKHTGAAGQSGGWEDVAEGETIRLKKPTGKYKKGVYRVENNKLVKVD